MARRGGLFRLNTTEGWQTTAQNEGDINLSGTDGLNLGSAFAENVPINVPTKDLSYMNSLGLGRNSTLLDALMSQSTDSRIFGWVWSVFWGLLETEKEHQMNGTLVFGGYDQAKLAARISPRALVPSTSCALAGWSFTSQISRWASLMVISRASLMDRRIMRCRCASVLENHGYCFPRSYGLIFRLMRGERLSNSYWVEHHCTWLKTYECIWYFVSICIFQLISTS